jgi:large conductance mechanosensitive channel
MLEEFKKFALRGNVIDLAIGVVIGAAFGKIVDSLVSDIIMPIIGAILGGLDFSNYFIRMSSAVTAPALVDAKKQGAVLAYGSFLTVAVNFLIIAFVLFMVVKAINTLQRKNAAAPPEPAPPAEDVVLLAEIRDLLKQKTV